jgi:soluble lytic murein transglycosylase-like protein
MIAQALCAAVIALSFPRAEVACKYMETLVTASEKYNLEPSLMIAMIRVESNWKTTAISRSRACGLTQVLVKYSKYSCRTLTRNPKLSIREGAKKLHFWIYKYGKGDVEVGLCGYNAGFRCKGKRKNKRAFRYAKKVLKYKKLLDEKSTS